MHKARIAKIGGFVGTLTAGAALVASAATGTGAYFTDSHAGSFTAKSGILQMNTTATELSFTGLNPGEDKTQTIEYNIDGATTGNADVWLVFNPGDAGYALFTGAKGDPNAADGGLGRYGHFAVSSNGSKVFESYNLQAGTGCVVDADGHGFGTPSTSVADTPPLCGVPTAIKLDSNLPAGYQRTVELIFGLTGRATGQNKDVASVPFKIVATQVGHRPDAANF